MARNEEGGVRTKKIIAIFAVLAMVFVAGAALIEESPDADASTSYIQGDTAVVAVKGTLSFQIMFYLTDDEYEDSFSINYTAELRNGEGRSQSNAVSPSTGSLNNGVESTLTITAPEAAGKYTLLVTFKVTKDGGAAVNTERTQTITVVEPIVLSATLLNNSNVDFTDFAVYFMLDGNRIENSKTMVSVAAGNTTTVTHNLAVESLSNGKHTFRVVAGEENIIGSQTPFVTEEGAFYVGGSDYGLFNILLGILLIVLILVVIYLYRKPVKNYGKPKARR